nr:ficolin-2 [Crassostrea gigas]
MTSVVDGIRMVFLFLSISEAMMCQQYRANLEVDNKVYIQAPSENLHDVSFATCSRSCINGCECFSFNAQSNMCRLYMYSSSCDPSKMTVSEAGWRSYIIYEREPPDCKTLYMNGKRKSGVYTIYPWERSDPYYRPVQVYCDMETEGGGWTAIQRRINGNESFHRNWTEYKSGFGSPHEDHWIGNDAIHQLTRRRSSSLRVTITPIKGGSASFKMYHQFYVFGEDQNYTLQLVNPGNGNLTDCLRFAIRYWPTGMQFSTFDVDNDNSLSNCAAKWYGGWWFNDCHVAYLNGPWLSKSWVYPWWYQYGRGTEVTGTSMLIK